MKSIGLVLLGVAVGFGVASLAYPASNCCARVAAGVRERVVEAAGGFGPLVAIAGDLTNVWHHTPGWLDRAGVPVDA